MCVLGKGWMLEGKLAWGRREEGAGQRSACVRGEGEGGCCAGLHSTHGCLRLPNLAEATLQQSCSSSGIIIKE
jgi:hypothetical protein